MSHEASDDPQTSVDVTVIEYIYRGVRLQTYH